LFQKDAYISVDFADREITLIRRNENRTGSLVPGADVQQLYFSETDVLEDELASYIQAVRARNSPVVSGNAGRKALAVALDIMSQVETAMQRYLERHHES
jgi:predicted dehydrogenase